jgi:hypothetical protein
MKRGETGKYRKSSCQTFKVWYLPPLSPSAGVAKSVDARDSKSRGEICVGSSPTSGTITLFPKVYDLFHADLYRYVVLMCTAWQGQKEEVFLYRTVTHLVSPDEPRIQDGMLKV